MFDSLSAISINWNYFVQIASQSFFELIWFYFKNGGFVFFIFLSFWIISRVITFRTEIKNEANARYIILAVDVPRINEQGPEVTERLFAHLANPFSGKTSFIPSSIFSQTRFSFEIISRGGRIQFLVRTKEQFRDLVESAFYGEYPNAQIEEVEDYTMEIPDRYPDPEYDIWGTEIALYNNDVYPIRTYPAFEHSLSGEFRDPISNLLEVMAKIKDDEQVWLQILITYGGKSWVKRGMAVVDKLIGKKSSEDKSSGFSGFLGNFVTKGLGAISTFIFESLYNEKVGEGSVTTKKEAPPSIVTYLSPGEKDTVMAVQRKISKIGFRTKIRLVYVAKKENFSVHRGITGILGALNQFNTLDMNGFKPDEHTKTQASPLTFFPDRLIKKRKNSIIKGYKTRSFRVGSNGYVLNIEELATLYHFPVISVEAPLVKKTGSKRGEPPFALPTKEGF